ncbi:putative UGA2-succinate semialdehyde dehydrogenase [Fusarium fujikuroi]|nr:putative UGA2-succinate semialdehyde dehydrogenase [Fusarium fujikuroi]
MALSKVDSAAIVKSRYTHLELDSLPNWTLVSYVPVMLQRGVKADLAMVPVTESHFASSIPPYIIMGSSYQLPFSLTDDSLFRPKSLINGEFVSSKEGKTFNVIDPGTGLTWASCPDCTASDVDAAVKSSYEAFKSYSKITPRFRAQTIMKWYNLMVAAREDLAHILVHETGKPLEEARGEIDYALTFVWWFSGEADRAHGSSITCAIPGRRAMTIKQPIGVAAALVPWNFPIALALRKAAAALAAGCTMIIKPSPETPLTAVSVAFLALKAGFPPGALNVVTTSLENTPAVAEALCLHPLVKKVSFTGSTRVGKIIASLCAQNLKKTTFELGGNCPFIVFDDANVDQAMNQLMALKWRHAGQACVSSNRVFVQSNIYDSFVERLVSETRKLKLGHGMMEGVTLGALTTTRGLEKAEELYEDAVSKGAKAVLGTGKRYEGEGYFMEPTILTEMKDEMLMTHEEIFAPLLGVYRFESEEEIVQRANDTPYGLASYVFTKNVDRLWRMFENLDAGMIGLNAGNSSSAEAPFGGIKDSGHGKESGKDVAIDEFLITKTGTMTVEGQY